MGLQEVRTRLKGLSLKAIEVFTPRLELALKFFSDIILREIEVC